MNHGRIEAVFVLLAIFAIASTLVAIYSESALNGPACTNPPCENQSHFGIYSSFSVPISLASWLALGLGLAVWRRSSNRTVRFSMMKAGFDRTIYELMVKMRGSSSRLSLLQSLTQSSRHRNELSEMTGMNWKEVDREIVLLEKHGFVAVETQAGPIKMYRLTEQGRSLVKLMDELKNSQTKPIS